MSDIKLEQLAASMGVGQTKYEESRYDAKTGTLYCQGMAISKSTAEKAVSYFETMAKNAILTILRGVR